MVHHYFITASGTGIGKTWLTCHLIQLLKKKGYNICALKPIISGWEEPPYESDTVKIIKSLDLPVTPALINTISPWRYHAPLTPAMAAAKEGQSIDFDALIDFCKQPHASWVPLKTRFQENDGGAGPDPKTAAYLEVREDLRIGKPRQDSLKVGFLEVPSYDYVFIEGVGGAMAPLTATHHSLDWFKASGYPAIVVVGSYLGSLSHTLTTLAALAHHHIPIQGVIVNESEESTVGFEDTLSLLKNFIPYPIIGTRRTPSGHLPDEVEEGLLQLLKLK